MPYGSSPPPPSPETWGGFLQKVAARDASLTKAAMAEGSGATGGYTVPSSLAYDLMKDVGEESLVRRWASVTPMSTREVLLPLPDAQTAVTAGLPPYFGGMAPRWTSEAGTRTQVEPAFRQVGLTAWELTGTVYVSNNLLADAPALDGHLRRLFARAIAWVEDYAFLQGDGVGKPTGMLSVSTAVTRSGSGAFANADAYGMVEKLLPSSWPNAIWAVHPSAFVKFPQLSNWQPNATREPARGPAGTLHEMPVYITDKLPALGTAGDVLLCDPTLYAIGDRSVEVAASEHYRLANNQTVFRVVARVGGCPWLSGQVTLADGTKTANAYVSLTTA